MHTRYFRQLLGGFVLPIPLFRVVSPGGEGRVSGGFRIRREAKIFTALAKPQNMFLPAPMYPGKLIAKFLKFAKESNKVQLPTCRLRL